MAGNVLDRRVFKSAGLGVGSSGPARFGFANQERWMRKFAVRLLTLATFAVALAAMPVLSAQAAGDENPAPPASGTKKEKKGDKSARIDDQKFLAGYRAAYATIYDRNDYAAAIDQLRALGHDDRADVA